MGVVAIGQAGARGEVLEPDRSRPARRRRACEGPRRGPWPPPGGVERGRRGLGEAGERRLRGHPARVEPDRLLVPPPGLGEQPGIPAELGDVLEEAGVDPAPEATIDLQEELDPAAPDRLGPLQQGAGLVAPARPRQGLAEPVERPSIVRVGPDRLAPGGDRRVDPPAGLLGPPPEVPPAGQRRAGRRRRPQRGVGVVGPAGLDQAFGQRGPADRIPLDRRGRRLEPGPGLGRLAGAEQGDPRGPQQQGVARGPGEEFGQLAAGVVVAGVGRGQADERDQVPGVGHEPVELDQDRPGLVLPSFEGEQVGEPPAGVDGPRVAIDDLAEGPLGLGRPPVPDQALGQLRPGLDPGRARPPGPPEGGPRPLLAAGEHPDPAEHRPGPVVLRAPLQPAHEEPLGLVEPPGLDQRDDRSQVDRPGTPERPQRPDRRQGDRAGQEPHEGATGPGSPGVRDRRNRGWSVHGPIIKGVRARAKVGPGPGTGEWCRNGGLVASGWGETPPSDRLGRRGFTPPDPRRQAYQHSLDRS